MRLGRATIDDVTMDEAIARVEGLIARRSPEYVVTPNVDHLVKLQDDAAFRAVYAEAALVLADGMPLVWASRLLGTPLQEKVSGSDLFVSFAPVAARRGYRLFFLGGREGAAARAAELLAARHPGLTVCGVEAPPVGFERDDAANRRLVGRIRAARPDLLFVGLGAPKQEKWIHRWRRDAQVPVSIGVGVSFEFVAGMVRRAPPWMQRAGLEWAWRLLMEPRRLWRRYLLEDTRFLAMFLRQWADARATRRGAPGVHAGELVDGELVDGALVDGGLVDGALVDGALVDGGLVDGGLVDGGLVDGALVDGGLVDGALVDGGLVDGALVDGGAAVAPVRAALSAGDASSEGSTPRSWEADAVDAGHRAGRGRDRDAA